MAEVTLVKQQVEPGKVSRLREWLAGVEDREDEALATLDDEGVWTESAFLEETPQGTFLVTYIEAQDLETVWGTFEASEHDIDEEYKTVVRECLVDDENVGEFEPLYHLANSDR